MSGGHSGQTKERIIAHCGQSFQCHVAGSLGSPLKRLPKARMPSFGQFTTIDPVKNSGYEWRIGDAHSTIHFRAHHALFNGDCLSCGVPNSGSSG
jgi:hypothetical protein